MDYHLVYCYSIVTTKVYKQSITIITMAYKDKERNNEYQRKWRKKNPERLKEINKKSEERKERIEYRKKWWNENPKAKLIKERFKENHPEVQKQYDKTYKEKNPERARKKYERYYNSIKGIINRLKKADKKRFNIINSEITAELITNLDVIYKKCPYCYGEFKPRSEYDHLNSFKPFSKTNIIKVCSTCNQSKSNANLLEWIRFKGYKISKEIIELYEKSYS